jgi:hypothetical protein
VTKVEQRGLRVLPHAKPADAQNFAQQLLEQGKKAKVFGGDSSNDASAFKVPGSRLELRPGHQRPRTTSPSSPVGGDNPKDKLGSFGHPAYLSTQVALNAIKKARRRQGSDQGSPRRRPQRQEDRGQEPILGGDFRFSTKSNDPLNAKFYIFRSVERLVQARRLARIGIRGGRPQDGRSFVRPGIDSRTAWTHSSTDAQRPDARERLRLIAPDIRSSTAFSSFSIRPRRRVRHVHRLRCLAAARWDDQSGRSGRALLALITLAAMALPFSVL